MLIDCIHFMVQNVKSHFIESVWLGSAWLGSTCDLVQCWTNLFINKSMAYIIETQNVAHDDCIKIMHTAIVLSHNCARSALHLSSHIINWLHCTVRFDGRVSVQRAEHTATATTYFILIVQSRIYVVVPVLCAACSMLYARQCGSVIKYWKQ